MQSRNVDAPSPEHLEHLERLQRLATEMQKDRPPHPLDDLRTSNPARYKRLSAPFEDESKMNEALKGFFKELGALREKYEIPDIHVAALANVKNGPLVQKRLYTMQYGDSSLRPFIVLSLYRQEHPMLQALIRGLSGAPSDEAEAAPEDTP